MIRIALIVFVLITFQSGLKAQLHDLDSLLEANKDFKQKFSAQQAKFDPFRNDKPLELSIIADFKTFNRQKDPENYHPAILQYAFNDTIVLNREIGIRARGNHRRNTCKYPPIKLNFKKSLAIVSWIKEFDKMKMVGSCQDAAMFEQYVLAEYTIYKMLNELTDNSFRVRLLKVNYIDTSNDKMKSAERMAFIIEPHQSVGERIGASRIEESTFAVEAFPQKEMNLINVFQYMIGNTDWSVPGLHNIAVFKPNAEGQLTPTAVPYDFDVSGMINAPYAVPSEQLGIPNVRTRLFRGTCGAAEDYTDQVQLFKDKKSKLYALVNDNRTLSNHMKSEMSNYLDSFYATLDNPKKWGQAVATNCK